MLEAIVSVALLTGGFFILVGSIGLLRLPDFFARLHAPTKATTLGLGAVLFASMIHYGVQRGALSLRELLIVLFLLLSAPVSAYMLAKAGRHLGVATRSAPDGPTPAPTERSDPR